MKLDYIEKVEEVLNKNITKYTNLDLLYKEFVELYTNDIYFKSIILSNFRSFGIVLFDTLDEYNDYLENRKYYDISYLDTLDMEKLYDFINHIQDSDNSSNEDEDIILN